MTLATFLSIAFVMAGIACAIYGRVIKKELSGRKTLLVLIVAVFVALVSIGFPLVLDEYRVAYRSSGIGRLVILAFLQSMQNAFRTFVLDGTWTDYLTGSIRIPMLTTFVGLCLNVVAPLLTFSAILSLLKEEIALFRVWLMKRSNRPLSLFSELNKDTIVLARDIRTKDPKHNLVFTDVYPEDDEVNYELKEQAVKLRAVMLRTDISELRIRKRRAWTEYFLLGHDEDENVMQARKIFLNVKGGSRIGIYVMAVQKGNALLLDSLTSTLREDDVNAAKGYKDMTYKELKTEIRHGGIVKMRRIDPAVQIALREVPKMNCVAEAVKGCKGKDNLSILLFANTGLSLEIIKMLLWYCQSDKFKPELNIIGDKIKNELELKCPDIIRTNRKEVEGDAFYDIEFIADAKFASADFQKELIEAAGRKEDNSEMVKRLLRTDAVIVDRGSDSATLETAINIRTIFERLNVRPEIYAICEDEEDVLKNSLSDSRLISYKNENYDIIIIGKRIDSFSYDGLTASPEEELGFCQHIKWIDMEHREGDFEEREEYEENLKRELLNYERHEYFRKASVSKAKYLRNVLADPEKELSEEGFNQRMELAGEDREHLDENTIFEGHLVFRPEYECIKHSLKPSDRWSCSCENCLLRRKLEHNRWNAYMRSEGYIPSPSNNIDEKRPIAGIHGNIVPFDMLDQKAREKDG